MEVNNKSITHFINNYKYLDALWLFLNVEDDNGIMDITQQLNNVNMFENKTIFVNNEAAAAYGKQQIPVNSNQQIVESSSMFKSEETTRMLNNINLNEEDKRPDFYDEMFS